MTAQGSIDSLDDGIPRVEGTGMGQNAHAHCTFVCVSYIFAQNVQNAHGIAHGLCAFHTICPKSKQTHTDLHTACVRVLCILYELTQIVSNAQNVRVHRGQNAHDDAV